MKFRQDVSTGALIGKAALKIKAELNKSFQEDGAGVTSEQWVILKCLWREEGVSQNELAAQVNKDKASVTRILNILEKNQLIERADDREDRRSHRIYLTERGRNLEAQLKPLARAASERLFQNLNECEQRELRRLLQKLLDKEN